MIGKTLAHYEITSVLGKGGMGEVYQAKDRKLGRDVAIKLLPNEFAQDADRVARFQREAKLLASLNHPNIAAIYGIEQSEGKRFLVLEFVEGETLAQRLDKGPLPLEDALAICRQIAEGLEAAHERGVIHRDLKPANVMVTGEDKVKLLDFGLAKALSDEAQNIDSSQSGTITAATTRPGVILGTAAYMSPEQAKGKAVDKCADIWAFGCILYECLTGRRVFEGHTATEILASVLKNEPDWQALPESCPPGIRLVLQRCLSKEAGQRLHHAADVRIQMEDARKTVEAPASAKGRWAVWAVAMAGILAAAWLAFVHFREEPAPAAPLIRFQISLPDEVSLAHGRPFLLSPDGRYLAFIAEGSDGDEHIWIRALDSLEARSLSGTESNHLSSLFWSPDSRFIAFHAGNKLKTVNIFGGPPKVVCDTAPTLSGGVGVWNRNDQIVFWAAEGPMSVPAGGGAASLLTDLTLKPVRREDIVASLNLDYPTLQRTAADIFPALLPDGRHFLYYRRSEKLESGAIYVGSLKPDPEAQDSKPLVADTLGFVYMPSPDARPGYLLFLRGQTLLAQLFDERRLELLGEPLPVADKVGSHVYTCFFSLSSNGVLVYRSGIASQFTQAMLFDRQGKRMGSVGKPGTFYGMAFSPDGEQAALGWDRTLVTTALSVDIWLFSLTRGTEAQFTFGKGLHVTPLWSPDGTRITFALTHIDTGATDLYQKLANGAKQEELLLKSGLLPTSWSRDGRFLLYARPDPETKGDLWVLPMEGDHRPEPVLRTEHDETDGRFSPDMRWVAYVSDESGSYEVYVREFAPHSPAAATESGARWRVSQGGGKGPRWRNDGRELYYRAPDGSVMAVEIAVDPAFRAGTPKILFSAPPIWSLYTAFPAFVTWDVSPDGNRFLLPVPIEDTAPAPFTFILNWTSLLKQ